MPSYYFTVFDGEKSVDHGEMNLMNLSDAKVDAIQIAGEMIRDTAEALSVDGDWSMDVKDGNGLILFTLMFLVTDAPSIKKH